MERQLPPGLRLAVNTQTPLVRFREGSLRADAGMRLGELVEGEDYKWTTGGVVRMLLPLLHRWRRTGLVRDVEWIAMGPDAGERRLRHEGLQLTFVGLEDELKQGYATVKERMWELLNSNPSTPVPHGAGGIDERAWVAFDAYQERSMQALREAAERMGGLDLAYIHDFQQLGVAAAWRGPRPKMIFQLHTPFPSALPPGWAEHFLAHLRRYDAIVVSTQRYAQNLREAGLDGPVHVIHPFIDPEAYREPSPRDIVRFRDSFDLRVDDRVILHVGRMDPMKGQDRLIRALPRILMAEPRARLVLVGNGSFSNSKHGGLGLDKGIGWRANLEALAKEQGVDHRVTFTGHLPDELLPAAYAACDVFALPSTREGFGLAAIEAWRQEKPVVVSDRAGVSELVEEGVSGHVVDCSDGRSLADTLCRILADPESATRMGRAGFDASHVATVEHGARELEDLVASVLEARAYARA